MTKLPGDDLVQQERPPLFHVCPFLISTRYEAEAIVLIIFMRLVSIPYFCRLRAGLLVHWCLTGT